jgi:hypothetical protein
MFAKIDGCLADCFLECRSGVIILVSLRVRGGEPLKSDLWQQEGESTHSHLLNVEIYISIHTRLEYQASLKGTGA